jgi:hypothetical protein
VKGVKQGHVCDHMRSSLARKNMLLRRIVVMLHTAWSRGAGWRPWTPRPCHGCVWSEAAVRQQGAYLSLLLNIL